MHKKLESELMSIAHSILQMKNKNDVVALKNKAQELYERLSVLAFVDEYIEITPDTVETSETLVSKIELAVKGVFTTPEQVDGFSKEDELDPIAEESNEDIESDFRSEEANEEILVNKIELAVKGVFTDSNQAAEEEEITEVIVDESKEEAVNPPKKQLSLEEEFKDAVSVDVTQDLFQKVEEKTTSTKTTLNDTLMQKNIQVGLNDRIAFVKHLFNHSQADFNRVLSQLNSIDNEKEAKNFINKMVKPDYNWSGKEEYEERLIALIERKF